MQLLKFMLSNEVITWKKNNKGLLNSWLALGVVVIGTFMSILDSSIVNIALPKMMSVFGMPLDDAKWIYNSLFTNTWSYYTINRISSGYFWMLKKYICLH